MHYIPRRTLLVPICMACLVAVSCRSTPHVEAPAMPGKPPAAAGDAATRPGEFVVAAGTQDTWNAVGQVLVRLEGVTYEGRALMLGLYAVRYRGERFMIVTRGLLATSERRGIATEVGAIVPDGKPHGSAAAVELLGMLERRLPAELARITAGRK